MADDTPAPVHDTEHCCRRTTIGVWRDEQLVDVQIHHHCGRTREHRTPADWWADR